MESIIMIVLLFAVMYFFMIRPENKRKKQAEEMRNSLKKGDVITTIGGIVGIVCAIADKDDTIVIETGSDRTKIRFRRSAISSVEKLDTGKDSKSTPVKK